MTFICPKCYRVLELEKLKPEKYRISETDSWTKGNCPGCGGFIAWLEKNRNHLMIS